MRFASLLSKRFLIAFPPPTQILFWLADDHFIHFRPIFNMFLIDILLHKWIVSTPPWAKSKCGVISINVNIRIGDMQGQIVAEENK